MVEFLENRPPGSMFNIADLMEMEKYSRGGFNWQLNVPRLHLYCDSAECSGLRYYRYSSGNRSIPSDEESQETFITYLCSNCKKSTKIFSLSWFSRQFDMNLTANASNLGNYHRLDRSRLQGY
jgi:hypothetical protein